MSPITWFFGLVLLTFALLWQPPSLSRAQAVTSKLSLLDVIKFSLGEPQKVMTSCRPRGINIGPVCLESQNLTQHQCACSKSLSGYGIVIIITLSILPLYLPSIKILLIIAMTVNMYLISLSLSSSHSLYPSSFSSSSSSSSSSPSLSLILVLTLALLLASSHLVLFLPLCKLYGFFIHISLLSLLLLRRLIYTSWTDSSRVDIVLTNDSSAPAGR